QPGRGAIPRSHPGRAEAAASAAEPGAVPGDAALNPPPTPSPGYGQQAHPQLSQLAGQEHVPRAGEVVLTRMPPMRAVIAERHGGPDGLTVVQRDAPAPGPGQLLVDVAAAGVNFADIYRREGRPPYGGEVPYVPGMEGAGTVAAAGPGADGPGVGDRV